MSISPGSIPTADSLVLPLQQQLAVVAQQIEGITPDLCVITPTDYAPFDQAVIFPLRSWDIKAVTNGRVRMTLRFEVLHCFRRDPLEVTLSRLQPFVVPWLTVLTAWSNQDLGGLAIDMEWAGSPGKPVMLQWGDGTYLCISNTVDVLTEFSINVQ